MVPFPDSDDPQEDEGGWTATLVPEKKLDPTHDQTGKGIPRYNVVLWNSDDHTFEYVERMLRELFGHTQEECHKIAVAVDVDGRAVILTTTKEHAELKRDQVLAYGKDENMKDCKGSLYATIEAVD